MVKSSMNMNRFFLESSRQQRNKRFKYSMIGVLSLFFVGFIFYPAFAKLSLPVPFSIQIPNGAWIQPFADACEETSLLMVRSYYQKTDFSDKKKIAEQIKELVGLEDKLFGFNKDTSAKLMVYLINGFMPYEARVVENPTIEMITNELDENHPVIVPLNGRKLSNHLYVFPGPSYHVVVLTGYDKEKELFFANDPGFKSGDHFSYSMKAILNANEDYVTDSKKVRSHVMIFTSPDLVNTSDGDDDKDGLTKIQEIANNTNLLVSDTDKDGYSDGAEVLSGYSPVVDESHLRQPVLIRISGTKKIYRIEKSVQHLVLSPEVMQKHEWKFQDVVDVSDRFANTFQFGSPFE